MLKSLIQKPVLVPIFSTLVLIILGLWQISHWQVAPLEQRIEDLKAQIKKPLPSPADKQTKAPPIPSTTDLKEIATLEKGRIDSENTIRTSLFQAVGGLLVFVTLYISWLTLKANEAKQVAERFSKAVEQLGNDNNIHVRLGGIFMLEQVAKDAEEKYYWQVMETLTAYVRIKCKKKPLPPEDAHPDALSWYEFMGELSDREYQPPPLPSDIQAVLTVLGRRKNYYKDGREPDRLDLHNTDLENADLRGLKNLTGVNFQEANLMFADFRGANLQDAELKYAVLCHAKLEQAQLQNANLQYAKLLFARLRGANFQGTKLHGANLLSADLRGIDYDRETEYEQCLKVDLRKTDGLTKEQLDQAYCEGAILPNDLPPR